MGARFLLVVHWKKRNLNYSESTRLILIGKELFLIIFAPIDTVSALFSCDTQFQCTLGKYGSSSAVFLFCFTCNFVILNQRIVWIIDWFLQHNRHLSATMSKRSIERLPEQAGTNTVEVYPLIYWFLKHSPWEFLLQVGCFMYSWTRRTEVMPFSSNGSNCTLQFG